MTTWFISDLHLDATRPAITRQLLALLEDIQGKAEALYILGDFFEYWVGDDALEAPEFAAFLPVVEGLHQLSDSGVKLYFQHGNRDFLVGERFAAATGCALLPEQYLFDLYGVPTLLLHGDTLCTDDIAYQQIRKVLRDLIWQQQFLALPIVERIRQAEAMRAQSRAAMQGKRDDDIMDVSKQTVAEVMQAVGVSRLIHGHTHRPAVHDFMLAGQPVQRIVLGDWHENRGSYLRVDAENMLLEF
ncbi:MAG TPA: UDP-2,3-diacylglucosamine diphosphatase [Candidatus Thiothrix moscowensis]|uniref:UDP-2,3-diacylglucosamine diphosphatase n=1 Tax=unclassified Thiothrix TaxID=2636184 RepID=UPI0025EFD7D1|nr:MULTISPECIES: UDP-2,3-diacylglucosamine diphosphatase [unclassified Thiothrix]HRJ53652.1 UDP-2,3-diacylglucosamine diphosphatase [Candidatus Thiothrix moscowensis]HRJ93734.1 UDP-2,3-diacylglucosamine diphosphatase [Candidatus Thiothrix moscowensis]